jgi:hypothetical protein
MALLASCAAPKPADQEAVHPAPASTSDGRLLFDGVDLSAWREVYGNEGQVHAEGGRMILEFGTPLCGATYQGEVPRVDYEVELEAARTAGTDFFLGLTFPVVESACTLILGGWGGATVGLSCIDGLDASENETHLSRAFEKGRPYSVRVRVERERIRVWVDGEPWIDADIAGRTVGVRADVLPSCPFGVASYATRAAIGPIRIRELATPAG